MMRDQTEHRRFPLAGLSTVARKKTPKIRVNVKASLSRRLREIRQEIFGEHGGPELSRRLDLPARTWYNYETGVTVPAEILLGFIEQTGASPTWLLNGEGPRYRNPHEDRLLSELTPDRADPAGPGEARAAVERGGRRRAGESAGRGGLRIRGDLAVSPLGNRRPGAQPARMDGHVVSYRKWLPKPAETIGVRLTDDAMHPILPAGSVVAIDRSVTQPHELHGQIVAACPDGVPMIRWLDVHGHTSSCGPTRTAGISPDPDRVQRRGEPGDHRPGRLVVEPIQPGLIGRDDGASGRRGSA